MSIDLNDEILQDFVVEAGEILENLGEQLIEMENNPEDQELLNAVFRGFHTVKGGAGFLNLTAMVDIAHNTEDLFNLLRQGELSINASLMDVVLRALDVINNMFEDLKAGQEPQPADAALLQELVNVAEGDHSDNSASQEAPVADSSSVGVDDLTHDEFNSMINVLSDEGAEQENSKEAPAGDTAISAQNADDITDDEFEALLDQLHGKGQHQGMPSKVEAEAKDSATSNKHTNTQAPAHQTEASTSEAETKVPGGADGITEDEFDALLDQLHGKGQGPTKVSADSEAARSSTPPDSANAPANKSQASGPAPKIKASTSPASSPAPQAESTVRVDTRRLDDIMNLVGELVLARNRLTSLRETINDENMAQAVANLDIVTSDLQGAVMKTRMQPVKKVFGRFPRVVRDLARNLSKEVQLVLHGEETDLDKNLVEALADPLIHLVRNSVDHGIEAPDVREAAGKDKCGTVILSAEQEGDHILLTISDDGGGMDPAKLRKMAVKKGIMDEESASRLTDKECYDLIFLPGASTKEAISDVSGRGVGMDVVKTRITQLNGSIDIDSQLGKGTTISIKVPLTLAILPTLMVVIGSRMFALPLSMVNEIFELGTKKTNVVDGQTVVHNRGKAPPLFFLNRWLLDVCNMEQTNCPGQVVMVQIGNLTAGFVVDQVVGQEEVVIKPLGAGLQGVPGLAGATITGDGKVALILDIPSLLRANNAQLR
ncbi:MAG: chemotaxis protein CheA [Gammaproteobacteria bacterium]|nr:chemotaxis protein CheA [Gammaproteobacteria bacterium]